MKPTIQIAWAPARKHPLTTALLLGAVLLAVTGLYHVVKPLPDGLSVSGAFHPVSDAKFLRDLSYVDADGIRRTDQQVFDRILERIGQAEKLLVLDLFLFNDYLGAATNAARNLSGEVTDAVIRRMEERPGLKCWFITDPINTVYGGQESAMLNRLRQHGVVVVMTRLPALRDSNPLYSAGWRLAGRAWPRRLGPMLPNPFGRGRIPLASWLDLLNFKANHRKTLIADCGGQLVGLVTSANPHDGSSDHHNVAVEFTGPAVLDLLATEAAVCAFSGAPVPKLPDGLEPVSPAPTPVEIRVLTERAIESACLELIQGAQPGESLELATFYLSSRPLVRALKQARTRGVQVRVLLDPNRDAFGREKNGIPNRPVAAELADAGIPVRWALTHGEQFHSKLIWHGAADGGASVILGSANHTRRNLRDFNLETCVQLRGAASAPPLRDVRDYLDLVWSNAPGRRISTDYSAFEDRSRLRRALYRLQEATGLSTF